MCPHGAVLLTPPSRSVHPTNWSYLHTGTEDPLKSFVSHSYENCGSAAAQTFSYDPFGNISKSGSPYQFQPTYNPATNRFATLPGTTPSYDANGNVTWDGSHNYAWDSNGNSVTVDTVGLTFDALDRMVEQTRGSSYAQIVYTPTGGKLALMNGQSLTKAFVPLPGQATAVYTSSGLDHYRHSDWLGSARLSSSPSRGYISSVAYAPFGETYASSGTTDASFTGQNPDIVSDDYDFLFREYTTQGRWPSPDPAGLAAVDPSNPQSWDRYAYVLNNPLEFVDPLGLDCYVAGTAPDGTPIIRCDVTAPFGDPELPIPNGFIRPLPCIGFSSSPCFLPTPPPQPSNLGCIQSIFNPSCKPPTCPAVFINSILEDLVGHGFLHATTTQLEPAAKAAAQAFVTNHVAERGLVVPLRSSIVRRYLMYGEVAGAALEYGPIIYSEVVGLFEGAKAWNAGTCRTIWSK